MALESLYINRSIEMLDGLFGSDRSAQYSAVSRLYNRHLGPVTRANVLSPEVTDLGLFTSSCQHSSLGELFPDLAIKQAITDSVIIPGGGKGIDGAGALVGGLGEIAERLLGVLHFTAIHDQLELASYRQLVSDGRRALGPHELPLFAEEQYGTARFPYQRFLPDSLVRWMNGVDLVTGDIVAVPAQLVLLYYKHHPDEARIAYPTTGGLAFHSERHQALLHGIYEVIERDAINTRWYARVPPRRVIVDPAALRGEYDSGWPTRWSTPHIPEVEIYLNETDLPVPVFTTLAIDRSRSKRALLGGGGASLSRTQALRQSLLELGQTRTSLKYYQSVGFKDIRADSSVSEMTDFFDTAIYYGFVENLHLLDWYRHTTDTVYWNDVVHHAQLEKQEAFEATVGWMGDAGMTPIAFDFGGASWSGAHLTRVLIPELTQACLPSHPYLGHPRFYNLPLGSRRRARTYSDLNPNPVPFP